ncbi:hypothetical protein RQP46_009059 [Phenoliferia psychrophenolica]
MTPSPKRQRVALVSYPPSQRFVLDSLLPALSNELPAWRILTSPDSSIVPDLQWGDYDMLNWDTGLAPEHLTNSYLIRKGLIRKNHLAHTLSLYLSKHPSSPLSSASLKTFIFALSFPDELDELLQDDLYELAESFASPGEEKWWILKAALADKGNGIRLFKDREGLEEIFEEFEPESEEEEEEESGEEGERPRGFGLETKVDSSQMQEWVIQEYISTPLLLDPSPSSSLSPTPRKFHLRVYVLCTGGLSLYIHTPFLTLFAPSSYLHPSISTDLSSHLTNTNVEAKVGEVMRETFKAGVSAGSGFQVLPNCFEIFGCDLLITDSFDVKLLEINACPDFTQTGPALQSVIDDLFASTVKVAVVPFFRALDRAEGGEEEELSEELEKLDVEEGYEVCVGGLRRVLKMETSRAW